VLNWIRDFGEANYEKPAPDSAIVVELDELWHFLQAKKTSYGCGRHMTVLLEALSTTTSFTIFVNEFYCFFYFTWDNHIPPLPFSLSSPFYPTHNDRTAIPSTK
jgi:hypothetical protein